MMAALIGMILKPQYSTVKSRAVILLTPNYSVKQVDSLLKQHPSFGMMHMVNTPPYQNSKQMDNYNLYDVIGNVRYVVGRGIPIHYLSSLPSNNFIYLPSTLPAGFTALFVKTKNILHRKNVIKGKYNNLNGKVWLYLSGQGRSEDSVLLTKKGEQHFELAFVPKQSGQFLFDVVVKDSAHVIREHVPINIVAEHPLKILILQHHPTFEIQFLKNFLQKKNHSLIVRYQISRKNFRFEYVNHDALSFKRLTKELLEEIDIVMTDRESLSALSLQEKSLLDNALNSGLGLLHLSAAGSRNQSIFFPFKNPPSKKDTTHIALEGKFHSFPATSRVENNPTIVALNKNKSGIVAGYTFRGAGKIGFQILGQTFKLSLSGDSIAYSNLWTPLIEQVARGLSKNSRINIVTPFPRYQNDQLDVEVISSDEDVRLFDDGVGLPLREHVSIDNVWHSRTWGGKPGWHTLRTSDESLSYFVSDSAAWPSLALSNQRRANELKSSPEVEASHVEVLEDVPPAIFFLIFILFAGFLWLSAKL